MVSNKRAFARNEKKRKDAALQLLDQAIQERALPVTVSEGEEIARQALEIARQALELIDEVLREQEMVESQRMPMQSAVQVVSTARQQGHAKRIDKVEPVEQSDEPPLDDWLICVPT